MGSSNSKSTSKAKVDSTVYPPGTGPVTQHTKHPIPVTPSPGVAYPLSSRPVESGDDIDSLPTINNEEEWQRLAHKPEDRSFAHLEVVKLVYHFTAFDEFVPRWYFIESKKYVFHWNFTDRAMGYTKDLRFFNAVSYTEGEYTTHRWSTDTRFTRFCNSHHHILPRSRHLCL